MPDLIDLPIEQARRIKWEVGRAKYGPEFEDDWLLEADGEFLDGANYASHGLAVEPHDLRPKIARLLDLSIEGARLCRELKAERDAHGL